MYSISVPLMNGLMVGENRAIYLTQLKKAEVDRVFLVVNRTFDLVKAQEQAKLAKENISIFKENGFNVIIWIGCTIGHGSILSHEKKEDVPNYVNIMSEHGTPVEGTFCPLDEQFSDYIASMVATYADCGADNIILDDDFRINLHGDGHCCFCELHMEKFRETLGEPDLTREKMRKMALCEKPNRYRKAYINATGDALRGLARKIRAAVDQVNENLPLSLCTTMCQLGVDGVLSTELTRILAGKNPPLLRLGGAPYWRKFYCSYEMTVAAAQMYAHACKNQGVELIGEGDSYPRPSNVVPATYLDLFDAILRTDSSFDGILKYMVDYTSSANYETAYLDLHCHNLPALKQVETWFADSKQCGIRVYNTVDIYGDSDFTLTPAPMEQPFPFDAAMLHMNSIPIQWEGDGVCGMMFGETARSFPNAGIQKGMILDGVSAAILTQKGVDVGIRVLDAFAPYDIGRELFVSPHETIVIQRGWCRLLHVTLQDSVAVLSHTEDGTPISYTYENADGQRFFVYLFDCFSIDRQSTLFANYERQQQLITAAEWIGGRPLPAVAPKNLNVITVCAEKEGERVIGLFNCFENYVIAPEIVLDRKYRELKTFRCTGSLQDNHIRLDGEIPPYSFVLLSVK